MIQTKENLYCLDVFKDTHFSASSDQLRDAGYDAQHTD